MYVCVHVWDDREHDLCIYVLQKASLMRWSGMEVTIPLLLSMRVTHRHCRHTCSTASTSYTHAYDCNHGCGQKHNLSPRTHVRTSVHTYVCVCTQSEQQTTRPILTSSLALGQWEEHVTVVRADGVYSSVCGLSTSLEVQPFTALQCKSQKFLGTTQHTSPVLISKQRH